MNQATGFSIGGLIMAALIVTAIYMGYRTWTLGESEEDYSMVCIGGHEYWRANFSNKGFLGIKLTSEGKPILCVSR